MKALFRICCLLVLSTLLSINLIYAQSGNIVSPEEFLGHKVGEDFKVARWSKVYNYFTQLGKSSERIHVRELGKSTEGNPFIIVMISDAKTIKDREKYKAIQKQLADPRGLSKEEEKNLIATGKTVILVTCNLHSTEIGSSQMVMELAYQLATENDSKTLEILENDIILIVPSVNPDGLNMVVDWYNESLGTPWEGGRMPWLYHKYVGHDTNRDWYMMTQSETRLLTEVLYYEWFPEIVYDIHQMGNASIRYFVPPFYDPINPNVDALIRESIRLLGGHIVTDLNAAGKTGVITNAMYNNWWHGGCRTSPYRHNMVGLLTEAASVRIASPIFQTRKELKTIAKGLPRHAEAINFAEPWNGGWWRLRDIVEYEEITCYSIFTAAAKYREMFLRNFVALGREMVEKGKTEPPFAYIIPREQRDFPTTLKMLEILKLGGIEIHISKKSFKADNVTYPAGSIVILLSQPYRNHVKDLFEQQEYPMIYEYEGGPPEPPYDSAGWTLPFQMGVNSISVVNSFKADLEVMEDIPKPVGRALASGSYGFILENKINNDFKLLNNFLGEKGVQCFAAKEGFSSSGKRFEPGAIIVRITNNETSKNFEKKGLSLGCELYRINKKPAVSTYKLGNPRTAMYYSWGASMDEGWTRWVLEQFDFPYTSLYNAEVKAGDLDKRYDTIILPNIGSSSIVNGVRKYELPEKYTGGITDLGVINMQKFVENGGTLVCIQGSCIFAIDKFNLPVIDIVRDVSRSEFFCPGSVLQIELDNSHPVAYGMGKKSAAYFTRSEAFNVIENLDSEEILVTAEKPGIIAKYTDKVLLLSGWIAGEDLIKGQPAIVEVAYGKGKIVLLGFKVHYRGQSHQTFRLLFNSIYYGAME